MKSLSRTEWALLVFIMVYSFIPAIGGLMRVLELAGGPVIGPANTRALSDPFPIATHIMASSVFLVLGALQFLPSLRRHHRSSHRVIGRAVVTAGGMSAVSGLWMTHYYSFPSDLQGNLLYWVRMVLGSLMIGLLIWAVIAIKSRRIFQHSAAMLRAYAIGQGASTQTFLGISWIVINGSEAVGPMRDAVMVFAWGANLLIAEILIWSRFRTKPSFAKSLLTKWPRFSGKNLKRPPV
jgi:hypothetical protein